MMSSPQRASTQLQTAKTPDQNEEATPAVPLISHQPTSTQSPIPENLQKPTDPSKKCISSCTHDGIFAAATRNSGHVYCSLCYHQYHQSCVETVSESNVFWVCPSCRFIAADVRSLHGKLNHVIAQNASLLAVVNQQQKMLDSLMSLETQVSAISSKLFPDQEDSDDDDDDEPEPEGDLMIGDSLIRDVTPTHPSLSVDCNSGATLAVIRKKIKAINPRKKKHRKIFIVAGTNDSSTKRPNEKIVSDLKTTIAAAQKVSQQVVVSSIPPRKDNRADPNKIDTLNQLFVTACNEANADFINHDNNFYFRDNTIDSSLLLLDQLHLSESGVKKMLSNLSLSDKAKPRHQARSATHQPWTAPATNVPPSRPQPLMSLKPTSSLNHTSRNSLAPIHFRGSGSPFSNFFPAPLSIWNTHFPTSEHAYQHKKCTTIGNTTAAAEILKATTPYQAKIIGDRAGTSDRWEDIKHGTMYEILRFKARQCPPFKQALINSQQQTLIEDTSNAYWGKGQNGEGLNMLGRILMTLRSELSLPQSRNFTPRPTVAPSRNNLGHTQPHTRQQQLRCFNCGEVSHTKMSCRLSAPLRCYSCNGLGHKQKFCTLFH